MTIIIILLFTYLANLLNIQPVYATGHGDDKQNIADIFVFGSGIFAAFLFALSLLAYRNLLTKRLLLVSAAFGIFAIHAIVSKLDLFTPLHIGNYEFCGSCIYLLGNSQACENKDENTNSAITLLKNSISIHTPNTLFSFLRSG